MQLPQFKNNQIAMKKLKLLSILSVFILLTAGCLSQQTQEQVTVNNSEQLQIDFTLFKGSWFDIKYPQNFIAKPNASTIIDNEQTYIDTDEAYFTSPDKTVEFFVYSPQWGGNPDTYLKVKPSEELINEKTEQTKESELPDQYGNKTIHSVTIKAKDNSYYRSFVSIKEQAGTGNDLHHVFGIKYKDSEYYEKYKEAYIAFQDSLEQYAD